jgi:hypothetical protein
MRPPLPPQMSVPNTTFIPKSNPGLQQLPTNLNYSLNSPAQTHLIPSSNKLDINLNINVNNDGSITTSTGQATPAPLALGTQEMPYIPFANTAGSGTSLGSSRMPIGSPFPSGQFMKTSPPLTTVGQPPVRRPLSS